MNVSFVEIPVDSIVGQDCDDCVHRLESALLSHQGIREVSVAGSGCLRVQYDDQTCSVDCVTGTAQEIGGNLARSFVHQSRALAGMDCYDCAQTIERAAIRVEGVAHCRVNFAAARVRFEFDTAYPQAAANVERLVGKLGYQLGPVPGPANPTTPPASGASGTTEPTPPWWRRRSNEIVTSLAAVATLTAAGIDAFGSGAATRALYALAVVLAGYQVARKGVRTLGATRRLDINFLMTIAVIGAVAIGAWLEAALVVVLFRIGEALEHYAVDRARRSLASLLTLSPEVAIRRSITALGALDEEVPASMLAVGDLMVVRPGGRLAADGDVVEGSSTIDQAAITGESIPVDKTVGSQVFAGTINGEGSVVVKVSNAAGDSTLDRVARAIADAQAQRSPAERWVDSFARVYTPAVLAAAALVAVVPPLLFDQAWKEWIYRALAFLILSCPCALVIATPVAVVAALARASQAGVIVKGGAHLESATRLRAVATDKTGTLTIGQPFVTDIISSLSWTDDDVLACAAAVESMSEHPIAKAILAAAAERGLTLSSATNFRSTRGFGAQATVDGRTMTVGNERFFSDPSVLDHLRGDLDGLRERGRTIVVVASDEEVVGVLGVADRIRPEAVLAMHEIRRLGVEHTVLLSGDHFSAARAIADEVGITDVRSDLLPTDKVDALDEIQSTFGPTAMIGDGVNDAPALAKATLGIAMGGAGSPTAIETADVILMGDDLGKVGGFLALAHQTKSIVRQNIAFSLATKAVAAIFALIGVLPLWLAVMADVGATLLVVINGLRLLRVRLNPALDVTPAPS